LSKHKEHCSLPGNDAKNWLQNKVLFNLGPIDHIHEERCDASVLKVSVIYFLDEKKMKSKEVIQRKIENLE